MNSADPLRLSSRPLFVWPPLAMRLRTSILRAMNCPLITVDAAEYGNLTVPADLCKPNYDASNRPLQIQSP